MKSLLIFARIIIIGCLWSIVFIEGIRVIMLCNWHFDIFWPDHWRQAIALWKAGWVIRAPKEWAFVIIIVTFIPMLITGWWTLCMVAWEQIIFDIIVSPMVLYRRFIKAPLNVITTNNKYGVVKRKSYKQIRPAGVGGVRMPISDYSDNNRTAAPAPVGRPISPIPMAKPAVAPTKKPDIHETIDHALFKFDDDDDDFDLDIDSFEKTDILKKNTKSKPIDDDEERPAKKTQSAKRDNSGRKPAKDIDFDEDIDNRESKGRQHDNRGKNEDKGNRRNKDNRPDKNRNDAVKSERRHDESELSEEQHSPVYDALRQKGYDVISGITIKNTLIDYIGVSDSEICLCLIDKETGDWLADEELFNGEEPLWFSENSHRISPVRKLGVARDSIKDKLDEDEEFELQLKSFVVVQMANIINADDMFDIWSDMDIDVTRINRGAPKEIPLFSKTLDEADGTLPKKDIDRLRKLLKSIK